MLAWLGLKAFGLPRYLWIALALAALAVLILWINKAEEADDLHNQEIGRTEERLETTTEVLQRTETANAAREAITQSGPSGDRVRYDQCLRSARNPENCKRFLPE